MQKSGFYLNRRMKIAAGAAGICIALGVLLAVVLWLSMKVSAPELVLVDGYEVSYGTEISVYDLVKSVQAESAVALTLSGEGEVASDSKGIVFHTIGVYSVEVVAEDDYGNQAAETIQLTVVDDTPPTIQAETVTVYLGEEPDYTAAVVATDDIDGDLSASVTVDDDAVDLDTVGTYQVTYRVEDLSGNEAECTGQVIVAPLPAEGLTLSQETLTLAGNGYAQLEATVEPEDWEGAVVWSSSDETVATVSGGLVYWQGAGTCVITAQADELEATCEVTCGRVAATSISLNQNTLTLDEGESATLSASVLPSNWSESIRWVSSDETVATVTDSGVVTWAGNGVCTITAYAGDDAEASCQVVCTGGFSIVDWIGSLFGGGSEEPDDEEKSSDGQHNQEEE